MDSFAFVGSSGYLVSPLGSAIAFVTCNSADSVSEPKVLVT